MANRRMLHKSVSYNKQLNSVSEFAQLLFCWTIPHLDDFGKINGDPVVLKAQVIPMSSRSVQEVDETIKELLSVGLIDRYEVEGKTVIIYPNFEQYQTGLNKRTKSNFPENPNRSENVTEVMRSTQPTEPNRTEPNLISANRTENKIAETSFINPFNYTLNNAAETAAKEVWLELEPGNSRAFASTYLAAAKAGISADLIYQFRSEIKQDQSIKNPGAVFNHKVKDYFKNKHI